MIIKNLQHELFDSNDDMHRLVYLTGKASVFDESEMDEHRGNIDALKKLTPGDLAAHSKELVDDIQKLKSQITELQDLLYEEQPDQNKGYLRDEVVANEKHGYDDGDREHLTSTQIDKVFSVDEAVAPAVNLKIYENAFNELSLMDFDKPMDTWLRPDNFDFIEIIREIEETDLFTDIIKSDSVKPLKDGVLIVYNRHGLGLQIPADTAKSFTLRKAPIRVFESSILIPSVQAVEDGFLIPISYGGQELYVRSTEVNFEFSVTSEKTADNKYNHTMPDGKTFVDDSNWVYAPDNWTSVVHFAKAIDSLLNTDEVASDKIELDGQTILKAQKEIIEEVGYNSFKTDQDGNVIFMRTSVNDISRLAELPKLLSLESGVTKTIPNIPTLIELRAYKATKIPPSLVNLKKLGAEHVTEMLSDFENLTFLSINNLAFVPQSILQKAYGSDPKLKIYKYIVPSEGHYLEYTQKEIKAELDSRSAVADASKPKEAEAPAESTGMESVEVGGENYDILTAEAGIVNELGCSGIEVKDGHVISLTTDASDVSRTDGLPELTKLYVANATTFPDNLPKLEILQVNDLKAVPQGFKGRAVGPAKTLSIYYNDKNGQPSFYTARQILASIANEVVEPEAQASAEVPAAEAPAEAAPEVLPVAEVTNDTIAQLIKEGHDFTNILSDLSIIDSFDTNHDGEIDAVLTANDETKKFHFELKKDKKGEVVSYKLSIDGKPLTLPIRNQADLIAGMIVQYPVETANLAALIPLSTATTTEEYNTKLAEITKKNPNNFYLKFQQDIETRIAALAAAPPPVGASPAPAVTEAAPLASTPEVEAKPTIADLVLPAGKKVIPLTDLNLKAVLVALGYTEDSVVAAVTHFQTDVGFTGRNIDGIVGKNTIEKLNHFKNMGVEDGDDEEEDAVAAGRATSSVSEGPMATASAGGLSAPGKSTASVGGLVSSEGAEAPTTATEDPKDGAFTYSGYLASKVKDGDADYERFTLMSEMSKGVEDKAKELLENWHGSTRELMSEYMAMKSATGLNEYAVQLMQAKHSEDFKDVLKSKDRAGKIDNYARNSLVENSLKPYAKEIIKAVEKAVDKKVDVGSTTIQDWVNNGNFDKSLAALAKDKDFFAKYDKDGDGVIIFKVDNKIYFVERGGEKDVKKRKLIDGVKEELWFVKNTLQAIEDRPNTVINKALEAIIKLFGGVDAAKRTIDTNIKGIDSASDDNAKYTYIKGGVSSYLDPISKLGLAKAIKEIESDSKKDKEEFIVTSPELDVSVQAMNSDKLGGYLVHRFGFVQRQPKMSAIKGADVKLAATKAPGESAEGPTISAAIAETETQWFGGKPKMQKAPKDATEEVRNQIAKENSIALNKWDIEKRVYKGLRATKMAEVFKNSQVQLLEEFYKAVNGMKHASTPNERKVQKNLWNAAFRRLVSDQHGTTQKGPADISLIGRPLILFNMIARAKQVSETYKGANVPSSGTGDAWLHEMASNQYEVASKDDSQIANLPEVISEKLKGLSGLKIDMADANFPEGTSRGYRIHATEKPTDFPFIFKITRNVDGSYDVNYGESKGNFKDYQALMDGFIQNILKPRLHDGRGNWDKFDSYRISADGLSGVKMKEYYRNFMANSPEAVNERQVDARLNSILREISKKSMLPVPELKALLSRSHSDLFGKVMMKANKDRDTDALKTRLGPLKFAAVNLYLEMMGYGEDSSRRVLANSSLSAIENLRTLAREAVEGQRQTMVIAPKKKRKHEAARSVEEKVPAAYTPTIIETMEGLNIHGKARRAKKLYFQLADENGTLFAKSGLSYREQQFNKYGVLAGNYKGHMDNGIAGKFGKMLARAENIRKELLLNLGVEVHEVVTPNNTVDNALQRMAAVVVIAEANGIPTAMRYITCGDSMYGNMAGRGDSGRRQSRRSPYGGRRV